ncbi:MAG TPA: TonB family protein [Chitinophagaceae bacterium]|nr:TonB family protein [Chitinophagaceae bacterium]
MKNLEGKIDDGTISPPQEIRNSKVLEAPIKNYSEDDNKFIPVEIEATFKGNWNAYIKKEIEKNIEELTEAGESGTCVVKFIVSKNGRVSDVEAITMKGSKLAEIAVNAIRKGPKWIPARQNDREVNAYRQQPVTFTINE